MSFTSFMSPMSTKSSPVEKGIHKNVLIPYNLLESRPMPSQERFDDIEQQLITDIYSMWKTYWWPEYEFDEGKEFNTI